MVHQHHKVQTFVCMMVVQQIQDVQVGDVVKSYYPIGMSMNDIDFFGYSTSDLSGSYAYGSVVVGGYSRTENEWVHINNNYRMYRHIYIREQIGCRII